MTVTPTPTIKATTIVRSCNVGAAVGRANPNASNTVLSNKARPKPAAIPTTDATVPITTTSSAELLDLLAQAVREFGQTIVMVTHDPIAASYADRVIFLGDGRIVDEMADPTADRVLDRIKSLEA